AGCARMVRMLAHPDADGDMFGATRLPAGDDGRQETPRAGGACHRLSGYFSRSDRATMPDSLGR
ncbi:MAG: hypothetical protein OEX97_11385, partial [Acidimicrobiia bacterium]|nr:hypothetical protein [Acidimicrobiia bacterium]